MKLFVIELFGVATIVSHGSHVLYRMLDLEYHFSVDNRSEMSRKTCVTSKQYASLETHGSHGAVYPVNTTIPNTQSKRHTHLFVYN